MDFSSSEATNTVEHPKLTITYACECGAVCAPSVFAGSLILSTVANATLGGLGFEDIDLAEYDPGTDTATLFFDGGLTTLNRDFDAVHVLENGHIVLSPDNDATLGGLSFEDGDLVDYDPVADTATLLFDGSALFADPSQGIKSVHVQDDGRLVLSTDDNPTLGGLSFTDIDLVEYDRATDTASLFFDGGRTTLNQGITAVHVLANGHLVLAVEANPNATLGGVTLQAGDLVDYDPVADTATLIFDGDSLFIDPNQQITSAHIGPPSGSVSSACDADYTPGVIVSEFSTAGYSQRLNRGVTYFPEGQVLNGVTSPAGGAWIAVGGSGTLWMVGMDGTELDGGYATGLSQLEGIAFIPAADPSDRGHLAIVRSSTLYYSDMSLPANASFTTNPLPFVSSAGGVAYIEGGTHDGNIAVADKGSGEIHIIDPSFNLVTTLPPIFFLDTPEGIAHLKNTDKFLVIDTGSSNALVFDTSQAVSQLYDLTPFSLGAPTGAAAAIHPTRCDHFFGDRPNYRYAYLNVAGGGGGGDPGYHEAHEPWTASNNDTWEVIDLSGFGVPADAVVEVAVVNAKANTQLWGGVRAVGSTLDRRLELHEAESGGTDVMIMHVQADGSSRIEHYSDTPADVTFILLGYWGTGTFTEAWEPFKAGASNSWKPHSLSAYGVDPSGVAEILIQNGASTAESFAGVRMHTSTINRITDLHEPEGGGKDVVSMFVNAFNDPGATIEVIAESDSSIDFYMAGHWSTPPGVYSEAYFSLLSDGKVASGVWGDKGLADSGVPADAVVQIMTANGENTAETLLGVREMGSSLDRFLNLQEAESGGDDVGTMHVNADGSSVIQWYDANLAHDHRFYAFGWWDLAP